MTTLRCSASMTPVATVTDPTPGSAPTWVSTSLRIWVRSGHPATVRATSTSTSPPSPTRTEVTMPSSTMSAPSSGSTTPRRADRTASSDGTAGSSGPESSLPVTSGLLTAAILPGPLGGPPHGMYRPAVDAGTLGPGASSRTGASSRGGSVPQVLSQYGMSRSQPESQPRGAPMSATMQS